jgi:hypothetical protein
MRLGQLNELIAKLRELSLGQVLNTAFVERVNLMLRQGIPALIRRTWSTAQEQGELSLHLEWWRGYYHFTTPGQKFSVYLSLNGPSEELTEIAKKTCNLSRSSLEYIKLEKQYEETKKVYILRYANNHSEPKLKAIVETYPSPERVPTLLVKRMEPGVCR